MVALTRRMLTFSMIQDAKSRPCKRCGDSFPVPEMCLYHVPSRGPKLFAISPCCNRSILLVTAEIAKCDPYCVSCLRIVSHENGDHLRGIKPAAIRLPGAPETLTQMLRREAKKMDARERRHRNSGKLAIDTNVSGVPIAPYDDTGDT